MIDILFLAFLVAIPVIVIIGIAFLITTILEYLDK